MASVCSSFVGLTKVLLAKKKAIPTTEGGKWKKKEKRKKKRGEKGVVLNIFYREMLI